MKKPEIAIIIKQPLISRGLVHYVRMLYPDSAIEVLPGITQFQSDNSRPQVILLDLKLLAEPKADNLEKLYTDNPESKLIGLGAQNPEQGLMRFLCAFIRYDANEDSILASLESCSAFLDQYLNSENPELISEREKEVLRGVALGLTNKEISDMLFISSHTVITHRKNISAKLGIKTIAGLAVYAVLNGIISPEEMEE